MDEIAHLVEYARDNSRFISLLEIALSNLSSVIKNNTQKHIELCYTTKSPQDYIIDTSKKVIEIGIGEILYTIDILRIKKRLAEEYANQTICLEEVENILLSEICTSIKQHFDCK
jgi:hypothetical protein